MIPQAGLKTPLHRSDWTTARLKFFLERKRRVVRSDDGVVTAFRDGMVTLRSKRREDGFTFADKEIGYQGVEPGDLVIHAMDGFAGAIGVSDSRGKCSPVYTITVPRSNTASNTRFWAYYLRNLAVTGFIESLAKGIRERSTDFRWNDAGNLLVNFPDLPTQKTIADFLDRETARIDQLIEKKQRLVDLLAEKFGRQTAALLQSTDREVPSRSLRWLVRVRSGDFISNEEIEKHQTLHRPVPVVGGNGIMAYGGKSNSPPRTIVIGRVGALCGNVHYTEERSWITDNALIVSVVSRDVNPMFLVELLKVANLNERASKSAQPLITGETVKALKIKLPSHRRQAEICAHISMLADRNQRLLGLVKTSVDRLREFRSALITAAVTGQIDVTTWGRRGGADRRLEAIQREMAS